MYLRGLSSIEARRHNRCPKIRSTDGQGREGISITAKFLADENISQKIVNLLKTNNVDVISIKQLSPGLSDETVLSIANKEQRVLLTFDSDFAELVFRQKMKAKGVILLKFTPQSAQHVAEVILNTLKSYPEVEGHFVIIRKNRVRVLRLK